MTGSLDDVPTGVLTRARRAVAELQPFGMFTGLESGESEAIARLVRESDLFDWQDDEIVDMRDNEFDKLLLSCEPSIITFQGDARPEAGQLTRLVQNCATTAGEAMPATDIDEFRTEHGFGVRWRAHHEDHELIVEGKYWSPSTEINRSVRGPRRFYEGPADPFWYLFWFTDEQAASLTKTRDWHLWS